MNECAMGRSSVLSSLPGLSKAKTTAETLIAMVPRTGVLGYFLPPLTGLRATTSTGNNIHDPGLLLLLSVP
jgi:hypothetical protein